MQYKHRNLTLDYRNKKPDFMTKILTLWRHAKAENDALSVRDHDRKLTERGVFDAALMADFLAKHSSLPDEVWCSTSARTRETLAALPTLPTRLLAPLYLASSEDCFAHVKTADDACAHIMIIGHNPGLHQFAHDLLRDSTNAQDEATLVEGFPTAAIAMFECHIKHWYELSPACATLQLLQAPKPLKAA